ncbi:uncharacterized protein LOC141862961 isoform X2 [Acropora palmata]|uniref:uncharacterized protein LOC141862961 isoform X2 n=1 Tax=Acropora palmata TaxID=6131 RepID=UPI003DA033AB
MLGVEETTPAETSGTPEGILHFIIKDIANQSCLIPNVQQESTVNSNRHDRHFENSKFQNFEICDNLVGSCRSLPLGDYVGYFAGIICSTDRPRPSDLYPRC